MGEVKLLFATLEVEIGFGLEFIDSKYS
ncbi:hypothetical protein LM801050_110041 [Listeria monocytogenes]|nr:hypothetical protein LM701014_110042 [Listeria monocytogenes]CUL21193.1 hypothetical protein LM73068_100041 [Listeria monocytogenes]CUL58147.1 hypothetical protein LM801050_110041 [Listeria monocytogenes]CUM05611.1 hypothetical protein LM900373_70042 [Listeria monocytogenes]